MHCSTFPDSTCIKYNSFVMESTFQICDASIIPHTKIKNGIGSLSIYICNCSTSGNRSGNEITPHVPYFLE